MPLKSAQNPWLIYSHVNLARLSTYERPYQRFFYKNNSGDGNSCRCWNDLSNTLFVS